MHNIQQMNVHSSMTVGQLVKEMKQAGVLGAGRIARAVSIMLEMAQNPAYTVFFTMAGPMVPGGLRNIIRLLIEQKIIDVIITSGANVVHDIIESLGYPGQKATLSLDDYSLRDQKLGRAGDILFEQEGFEALEQTMHQLSQRLYQQAGPQEGQDDTGVYPGGAPGAGAYSPPSGTPPGASDPIDDDFIDLDYTVVDDED